MVQALSNADRRLRWGSEAFQSFESVWSIVHKFSHWNCLTPKEITEILWEPTGFRVGPPNFRDGNTWNDLSFSELKRVLGLSDAQIILAESRPYDYQIDSTSLLGAFEQEDHLRFCKECVSLGFHSPLFQMPWIEECPIHGSPVEDECPSCARKILYRIDSDALSLAYGCPACGGVLWRGRDVVPATRLIDDYKIAALADCFFKQKAPVPDRFAGRFLFALERTPVESNKRHSLVALLPRMHRHVNQPDVIIDRVFKTNEKIRHTAWDFELLTVIDRQALRGAVNFDPMSRPLRPKNLRPTWRTKVDRFWDQKICEGASPNCKIYDEVESGFRFFVRNELLSKHAECFRKGVDVEKSVAGETFHCCPWTIAFDRWLRHWDRYRHLKTTQWGSANLFSTERDRRYRDRCTGSTIWASDTFYALQMEYRDTTLGRKSRTVKDKWGRYRARRASADSSTAASIKSEILEWMVCWLLNQRLLETFAIEAAKLTLLGPPDRPIRHIHHAFFALELPHAEGSTFPVLHIWQRDLMHLIRRSSQLDCEGRWVERTLSLPVTHDTADQFLNES
jgi:predicted RNA-binding Zn-ribbon protein involved in translation (DUF1610 family)